MKRLTNEQILNYLDGALDETERARIEAHLRDDAEDARLIEEMRFALGAVREWHEADEPRVGANFWPQLREQLGPTPRSTVLGRARRDWKRMFASAPRPSHHASVRGPVIATPVGWKRSRLSWGAAMAALVLALSALLWAPRDAVAPVQAELSEADRAFVTRALENHEAYIAAQPLAGDVATLDRGADFSDDDAIR